MTPPTEKQINYLKGICEALEIPYREPETKSEATARLSQLIPKYRQLCELADLEWEANHSDLENNCGCWED